MKTEMNEAELRELDAWCAEFPMGFNRACDPDERTKTDETLFWHRPADEYRDLKEAVFIGEAYGLNPNHFPDGRMFQHSWKFFSPTTNPADAMMVLKKCAEISDGIGMVRIPEDKTTTKQVVWWIGQCFDGIFKPESLGVAPTLELAICRFARKIWSE